MSLTPEDLTKLCEVAIEAARMAGKHISETRPTEVQRKDGGDTLASQVLTEVDGIKWTPLAGGAGVTSARPVVTAAMDRLSGLITTGATIARA